MSGYPWGAFGQGVGAAAVTAFAVLLLTFAVAVVKGLHRIVDIVWGRPSPRSRWSRMPYRRGRAATGYGGS